MALFRFVILLFAQAYKITSRFLSASPLCANKEMPFLTIPNKCIYIPYFYGTCLCALYCKKISKTRNSCLFFRHLLYLCLFVYCSVYFFLLTFNRWRFKNVSTCSVVKILHENGKASKLLWCFYCMYLTFTTWK